MASDAAVSQMIFFIAAILVAAGMAGVFLSVGYNMASQIEDRTDAIGEQVATDVRIINDPVCMPYTAGNLTVYVENAGSNVQYTGSLTVLLDGVYINDTYMTILGESNSYWGPSVVLQINIEEPLAAGDHFIKVVTKSGASDTLTFRI